MSVLLDRHVPQDRRQALATGGTLPERVSGAALFADLVGFTPLGHRLARELGARRGVEELARRVNAVYDALIDAIEQRRGSVIGFAGDALACWFDDADQDAARRAIGCAQAMQQAMHAFEAVQLKTAVTRGPARRFVVGDPQIQLIDTLAGATVARLASAERLARPSEVVVDRAAAQALGDAAAPGEWRTADDGERFAVLAAALDLHGAGVVPAAAPLAALDAQMLRPWVLPAVYEREQSGHGTFLTELRPTVALFLRFEGIDYDADENAGDKLDRMVRRVQSTLAAHDGALLQLTIGDKGSYCYGAFGAPVAHEDDALRALRAAHELVRALRELRFLAPVQIGLSAGTARTGAYGGRTRATYGVLGDDVNLAARLMALAAPGEILLSEALRRPAVSQFALRTLQPLQVKGFAEPLSAHALLAPRSMRTTQRVQERRYGLAMVGRQRELALIERKLVLAAEGQAQVIGITGEAGIGKSRLVAEAVPFAQRHDFRACAGQCEAVGQTTPYLVWRPIWRALLGVDADADDARRLASLHAGVAALAPQRIDALPTLAPLLGLTIEDTEFTRVLGPQDRANVLTALLEDCLESIAAQQPLLFALEDAQWIDPLSLQLLEDLARVGASLPLMFILAYRPQQGAGDREARMGQLPAFTRIVLHPLEPADVERLTDNKLGQWDPSCSEELASALAAKLNVRAEGNPFYIEELLNHLCERHKALSELEVDASRPASELPPSLEALILGRIDGLSEAQRATLKTASVIGRHFRVDWLHGFYPELGELGRVKSELAELDRLDLTPLDTPEPDLAYAFKHVVTRDVAYESMPHATRAQLHEQLALYIESLGAEQHLDLLAHHWSLSHNVDKQREYLMRAARAAQAMYANEAALEYLEQLRPLVHGGPERLEIELQSGRLLTDLGRWPEAEAHLRAALVLAQQGADAAAEAAVAQQLGTLFGIRGDFDPAREWLQNALALHEAHDAHREQGRTLAAMARTWASQEAYANASECAQRAIHMARDCGDEATEVTTLSLLGNVTSRLGDGETATALLDQALVRARALDDKPVLAVVLTRRATRASENGDFALANTLQQESLALARALGNRDSAIRVLQGMGALRTMRGEYAAAKALFEQANLAARELGSKPLQASMCLALGRTARLEGDTGGARVWLERSIALYRELGIPARESKGLVELGYIALCDGDLRNAAVFLERALVLSRASGAPNDEAEALDNLGLVSLRQGDYASARERLHAALELRHRGSNKELIVFSLTSVAALHAHTGEATRAARVAAAAHAVCEATGLALDAFTKELQADTVTRARDALSPMEFEAAWAEGGRMAIGEAVATALGD
jgi:predicted ATPase/class 3 adenylate cyclase